MKKGVAILLVLSLFCEFRAAAVVDVHASRLHSSQTSCFSASALNLPARAFMRSPGFYALAVAFGAILHFSLSTVEAARVTVEKAMAPGLHEMFTLKIKAGWGVGDVAYALKNSDALKKLADSVPDQQVMEKVSTLFEHGWYGTGGAVELLTERLHSMLGHKTLLVGDEVSLLQLLGLKGRIPEVPMFDASGVVVDVGNPFGWLMNPTVWLAVGVVVIPLAVLLYKKYFRRRVVAVPPAPATKPSGNLWQHSVPGVKRAGPGIFRRWSNEDWTFSEEISDQWRLVALGDGNSHIGGNPFLEIYSWGGHLAARNMRWHLRQAASGLRQNLKSPNVNEGQVASLFTAAIAEAIQAAHGWMNGLSWLPGMKQHGTTAFTVLFGPESFVFYPVSTERLFGVYQDEEGSCALMILWEPDLHTGGNVEARASLPRYSAGQMAWGNLKAVVMMTDGISAATTKITRLKATDIDALKLRLRGLAEGQIDDATILWVPAPQRSIQSVVASAPPSLIALAKHVGVSIPARKKALTSASAELHVKVESVLTELGGVLSRGDRNAARMLWIRTVHLMMPILNDGFMPEDRNVLMDALLFASATLKRMMMQEAPRSRNDLVSLSEGIAAFESFTVVQEIARSLTLHAIVRGSRLADAQGRRAASTFSVEYERHLYAVQSVGVSS